jgi:tetratricopeptide (TPR) repeat protein
MYKAQDLDDKELEVLTFLSMVDPTDEIVEAKLNDLKKRRAKVLLESKLEDRFLIPRSKQAHFSQDESESQEKLYHAILERVQDQNSNPDLIYEYAVTLSQMDLFKEALEVLKYIPSLTVTQSWLKLNLLKNTHQYLKALEFLDQLETMDPQDESHELAIQYERAIIYFYLNQKNKALQLLQEMAGLNPDYRDISTLIRQWRSS